MANRQPGHYTFGRRNSVDIYKIYDMVGNEFSDPLILPYTRVYDTDFKLQKNRGFNLNGKGVWVGDNQTWVDSSSIGNGGPTGINFYTGMVVALAGTGVIATGENWGVPVGARNPTYTENLIGIVVGGTGPTSANLPRGPRNTGNFTGTVSPKYEDLVIQYAGQCPVLLQAGESVSIRGRFLGLSSLVSGPATSNVTAGLGQYAVCLTNSFASGMTGGHGPGLTGLTGNYVYAFVRPVETN